MILSLLIVTGRQIQVGFVTLLSVVSAASVCRAEVSLVGKCSVSICRPSLMPMNMERIGTVEDLRWKQHVSPVDL